MGRTSDARQRLMDAAYDLIWEYSYGAVTIEAICERAAVKKGSFYYFFASKSELAVVVLEAWWTRREAVLKEIFQPHTPPLERIRDFLDFAANSQSEYHQKSGHVLGCPIYGLGAEICNQDQRIRERIQRILDGYMSYFQEAIREAQSLRQLPGNDAAKKARMLSYYYAGVLTQGRIENDLEGIRRMSSEALAFIAARDEVSGNSSLPPDFLTPAELDAQLARSR